MKTIFALLFLFLIAESIGRNRSASVMRIQKSVGITISAKSNDSSTRIDSSSSSLENANTSRVIDNVLTDVVHTSMRDMVQKLSLSLRRIFHRFGREFPTRDQPFESADSESRNRPPPTSRDIQLFHVRHSDTKKEPDDLSIADSKEDRSLPVFDRDKNRLFASSEIKDKSSPIIKMGKNHGYQNMAKPGNGSMANIDFVDRSNHSGQRPTLKRHSANDLRDSSLEEEKRNMSAEYLERWIQNALINMMWRGGSLGAEGPSKGLDIDDLPLDYDASTDATTSTSSDLSPDSDNRPSTESEILITLPPSRIDTSTDSDLYQLSTPVGDQTLELQITPTPSLEENSTSADIDNSDFTTPITQSIIENTTDIDPTTTPLVSVTPETENDFSSSTENPMRLNSSSHFTLSNLTSSTTVSIAETTTLEILPTLSSAIFTTTISVFDNFTEAENSSFPTSEFSEATSVFSTSDFPTSTTTAFSSAATTLEISPSTTSSIPSTTEFLSTSPHVPTTSETLASTLPTSVSSSAKTSTVLESSTPPTSSPLSIIGHSNLNLEISSNAVPIPGISFSTSSNSIAPTPITTADASPPTSAFSVSPKFFLITGTPSEDAETLSPYHPLSSQSPDASRSAAFKRFFGSDDQHPSSPTTTSRSHDSSTSTESHPSPLLVQTVLVSTAAAFAILVFAVFGVFVAFYRRKRNGIRRRRRRRWNERIPESKTTTAFSSTQPICSPILAGCRRFSNGNINNGVGGVGSNAAMTSGQLRHFSPPPPSLSTSVSTNANQLHHSSVTDISPFYYDSSRSDWSLISTAKDRQIDTYFSSPSVFNTTARSAATPKSICCQHQQSPAIRNLKKDARF